VNATTMTAEGKVQLLQRDRGTLLDCGHFPASLSTATVHSGSEREGRPSTVHGSGPTFVSNRNTALLIDILWYLHRVDNAATQHHYVWARRHYVHAPIAAFRVCATAALWISAGIRGRPPPQVIAKMLSFKTQPHLVFLSPHRRHGAPINVKFSTEEKTMASLLHAKFHNDRHRRRRMVSEPP